MSQKTLLDVVVIGGGTAGLSAATIFGRALRRVVVLDDGAPRNAPAHAVGGAFGHDGTPPLELLETARSQLAKYKTIEIMGQRAADVSGQDGAFSVQLANGATLTTKKVMFATGVKDELPDIPGFGRAWGDKIFHCPFCHAYEVKNQPLGILINGDAAVDRASMLSLWSSDLRILTNGPSEIGSEALDKLQRLGVAVVDKPIEEAVFNEGAFWGVKFKDGSKAPLGGIMVSPAQHERSGIPAKLGLKTTESGHIEATNFGETSMPGVLAVGDITTPAQSVIVAAGRAAEAAYYLTHTMSQQIAAEKFAK